jgi:hypothetical protein
MHGQVRAKTKDGKEKEVVGWLIRTCWDWAVIPDKARLYQSAMYISVGPKPPIVPGLRFVEQSSIAVDTGKLDKHGDRIYGSVPEMGFKGGDSVIASGVDTPSCVYWHAGSNYGQWVMESDEYIRRLYGWESSGLEIITDEKGK